MRTGSSVGMAGFGWGRIGPDRVVAKARLATLM